MNTQTEELTEKTEELSDDMKQYREGLVETQRKLNESYDKLIITLSAGALALSITFLKDIIGSSEINHPLLLLFAWGLFVLSLTSISSEILFGIKAHKEAIKQIDNRTIHKEKVGGKASLLSTIAHLIASISLILGLLVISIFAYYNVGENHGSKETSTKTTAESTTKAKPTTKQ